VSGTTTPGYWLASTCACNTHRRSDSAPTPTFGPLTWQAQSLKNGESCCGSELCAHVPEDLVDLGEAAEVALTGAHDELAVLQA
jgi:hypothetical protein